MGPMATRTALPLDAAAVLAFVVIGRSSHEEGITLAGTAATAAPFALGLAAGWLATRAWRRPDALATGAGVWAATVGVGLLVRSVAEGEMVPLSFAIVTAVFLAATMIGWRAVARGLRARRTATAQP